MNYSSFIRRNKGELLTLIAIAAIGIIAIFVYRAMTSDIKMHEAETAELLEAQSEQELEQGD